MEKSTEKMLNNLAKKLGTTATKLWKVLVGQAKIESKFAMIYAIAYMVITVLFLIGAIALFIFASTVEPHAEYTVSFIKSISFVGVAVCVTVAIAFITEIISKLEYYYTCKNNPEYYALSEILDTIDYE